MERDNSWPPFGLDPNLPADHQGINDPGNDLPDVDEDGLPIILDDADFDDTLEDDNFDDL